MMKLQLALLCIFYVLMRKKQEKKKKTEKDIYVCMYVCPEEILIRFQKQQQQNANIGEEKQRYTYINFLI